MSKFSGICLRTVENSKLTIASPEVIQFSPEVNSFYYTNILKFSSN